AGPFVVSWRGESSEAAPRRRPRPSALDRVGRMNRRSRRSPSPSSPRPLTGTRLAEALIAGWRPLQRLDTEGFAVLRSRGITRRAHSILALDAPTDAAELTAALDRVESLVSSVGETPTHRLLDGVTPPQLETLLAERGDESVGASEILE